MNAQEPQGEFPDLRYDDTLWDDLPAPVQFAAQVLGYNQQRWNEKLPPRLVTESNPDWNDLTTKQQQAATVLGYTEETWWYLRRTNGDGDPASFEGSAGEEPAAAAAQTTTTTTTTTQTTTAAPTMMAPTLEWEAYDWQDLPETVQQAYTRLGWSEELWDNGLTSSTDDVEWSQLTAAQQQAALFLGYTEALWDGPATDDDDDDDDTATTTTTTTTTTAVVTLAWDDNDWEELPDNIQQAFAVLGYNQALWDAGDSPATEDLSWDELSISQQAAALEVGYTQELWDGPEEATGDAVVGEDSTSTSTTSTTTTDPTSEASVSPAAQWYDSYWADLPPNIQAAFAALGYTQEIWDNELAAPTDDMEWTELSPDQQAAAVTLGYDQALWDNEPETSAMASSAAYVSEDDDYVFLVSSARDVWVSRYMILYFAAALCFVLVGWIDWYRERKAFHMFMILAGLFGLISSMLVEKDRTASTACNLVSVHFFFLEGLNLVWYRIRKRRRASKNDEENQVEEDLEEEVEEGTGRSTSIMSGLWWISPLEITADSFFFVGAFMDVVLSYFYFDRSSDWSLSLARVFGFSTLLWLCSALIYTVVTLVLYYGWFPCCVGGDKLFLKRGITVDDRQKELRDMHFISPLPTQSMDTNASF